MTIGEIAKNPGIVKICINCNVFCNSTDSECWACYSRDISNPKFITDIDIITKEVNEDLRRYGPDEEYSQIFNTNK